MTKKEVQWTGLPKVWSSQIAHKLNQVLFPITKQKYAVAKQKISIGLKSWRSCSGDPTNLKFLTVESKVLMMEGRMTTNSEKKPMALIPTVGSVVVN